MEYVDSCMVLHGASADQDSETGSWCGLWLAHCAVASTSFRPLCLGLGFPNSTLEGHPHPVHRVFVQMKWCRDIMGYECETVTLRPVKIFQKPEDSVEGTQEKGMFQRKEASPNTKLSDGAALETCKIMEVEFSLILTIPGRFCHSRV